MTTLNQSWSLACENVALLRGRREVLRDVSLAIRCDECLTLIGPNGAGKTSLLLALLGILAPSRGRITLAGRDLRGLDARRRGRLLAYVPQSLDQLPGFTVYDVVAAGRFPHVAALRPLSDEDHAAVRGALERCGLASLAGRPIRALSGGERQKALVAAALAQDARMMLLDEPTTSLDPAVQVELLALLREWRAGGRGLVVVSHDLQLPAALGGRVVAIRDGRLVGDGPAGEVLAVGSLRALFDTEFDELVSPSGRTALLPAWRRE